ncbi:MAG: NUDIX hydrolase [Clostridiales bacterium]|nr:NUDIX hydrolase [Clostridiales bacterium]
MKTPQSSNLDRYFELMAARPEEFRNSGPLTIVTDREQICQFAERTGKPVGVVYESAFHLMVVDVVQNGEGACFTYERILSTNPKDAVVVIPRYQNQYVLLLQYRHALRDYQYAFPRGFGEGLSALENAHKEVREELRCTASHFVYLGQVVADSGLSGTRVKVYQCEISKPNPQPGYEEIQKALVCTEQELHQKIGQGKINDGFTLSALCLQGERS